MSGVPPLTLANDSIRERAANLARSLPQGWRVTFSEPVRSNDQNARMWAMLHDISEQVDWWGQKLSPEDWKDLATASLHNARVVPGLHSGFVVLGMRTSKMSKAQMSDLIETLYAFGAEHHVRWNQPVPCDETTTVRKASGATPCATGTTAGGERPSAGEAGAEDRDGYSPEASAPDAGKLRPADKIAVGLREAIAVARGEEKPARLHEIAAKIANGEEK